MEKNICPPLSLPVPPRLVLNDRSPASADPNGPDGPPASGVPPTRTEPDEISGIDCPQVEQHWRSWRLLHKMRLVGDDNNGT